MAMVEWIEAKEVGLATNQFPTDIMGSIANYPEVYFNKLIAEPFVPVLLAYGIVWFFARPKDGRQFSSPLLLHLSGFAVALFGSALVRVLAMVMFGLRSAYDPSPQSGAAAFFILILPAAITASFIAWRKDKANVENGVSRVSSTSTMQTIDTLSTPQNLGAAQERIYADIAAELESGDTDKALWTRLFAECDGDENRTRVAYIKQRASKLLSKQ